MDKAGSPVLLFLRGDVSRKLVDLNATSIFHPFTIVFSYETNYSNQHDILFSSWVGFYSWCWQVEARKGHGLILERKQSVMQEEVQGSLFTEGLADIVCLCVRLYV